MMIIDGEKIAREREVKLAEKVNQLKQKGISLKLVSLVMSEDEAGLLYSKLKKEASDRVGIVFKMMVFDDLRSEKMIKALDDLSGDDQVQGVMIQRPGYSWAKGRGMEREEFERVWKKRVEQIKREKDVDGLREDSNFSLGAVKAIEMILENHKLECGRIQVCDVVVVGSGGMVGRKLIRKLKQKGVKVTGVHSGDKDLEQKTLKADWLVTATGRKGLITDQMVKKGAGVIDVGWPKGDVKFDEVSKKAKVITPVPGGIGPITVVCLLENLVDSLYTAK